MSQDQMNDVQQRAATFNAERQAEFMATTRLAARDEAESLRMALRAIIYARDLAPDAPIPTALLAAIEGSRKVLL